MRAAGAGRHEASGGAIGWRGLSGTWMMAMLLAAAPPAFAQSTMASSSGGSAADTPVTLADITTPAAGMPDHETRAPVAVGARLDGRIELDGRLDEPAWRTARPTTGFVQKEPVEGAPPTRRTDVRFLYDGETLYVGARMHDEPEAIVGRLVRRDADSDSDLLVLTFDTHLDHLGQTQFSINPRGVRGDAYGPGGSDLDDSWDPVWRAETRVDTLGWTAELAIPFSQLRFPRGVTQRWGLQIERVVQHTNEYLVWSFWPRGESGGPSRYGHLEGIAAPEAGTDRLEILPYTVGRIDDAAAVDPADPFGRNRDATLRVGADARYLLTSNLTLTATVNPDFGQAEVDPAVVNLSAFETFFPEKREFFIEGSGLFDFGGLWCFTCSNISSLSMLHTRRIGRTPQGLSLAHDDGAHVDAPDASTILGAAKLTGRTAGGLSIGVLEAMTGRETAAVARADGSRTEREVAPFTNHFVARVKQDFLDGDLQLGGIATSVIRSTDDRGLDALLGAHSEGIGFDAEYWWADRTYHLMTDVALTNVSGSAEAIDRLQRSSARYFQRPDRTTTGDGLFAAAYDPSRTSLRGYGLYTRVAKESGALRWESQLNVRSPGFENNDYAFLSQTDFIWMHGNVQYRWTEPTRWYRWLQTTFGAQQKFNFDGDLIDRQFHSSSYLELPSFWEMGLFARWRPSVMDERLTRGGPVVAKAGTGYVEYWIETDDRGAVTLDANGGYGWALDGGEFVTLGGGVTYRPASSLSVSLSPRYEIDRGRAQYVTAVDDPTAGAFYGRRYVFADIDQRTLSMTTRLSWTFTPDMSLEVFVQPFVSTADYGRFKEFAAPRQVGKLVYGEDVGSIRTEREDETIVHRVDPDGPGPAAAFRFGDPDFTFRSVRGNLVFRWEYVPGSTLYFVWTQDRNAHDAVGEFGFGRSVGGMFDAPAENVFLLKATYRLGL